jgi:hypothetical protein
LGLKPSTGRTTGKETPPMSSDFDPLQACPKPVQTHTRRMVAVEPSFARLVTSPRQPPVAAPGPPGGAARSENTLRPALDQLRVSDSADTPAAAGVTFVGRCRACEASEMMISGLALKGSQCRSVLSR